MNMVLQQEDPEGIGWFDAVAGKFSADKCFG